MNSDRYILGMEELDAQLALLEKQFSGDVMSETLAEAAVVMQHELQNAAPFATGTLRGAIRIVRRSTGLGRAEIDIIVDKDAWYWRFSEFGTVHEPAQAWARRAIRRMRPIVNSIMFNRSRYQIERIAA